MHELPQSVDDLAQTITQLERENEVCKKAILSDIRQLANTFSASTIHQSAEMVHVKNDLFTLATDFLITKYITGENPSQVKKIAGALVQSGAEQLRSRYTNELLVLQNQFMDVLFKSNKV